MTAAAAAAVAAGFEASLLEVMIQTEHILPLSCQSTSLCLGDKVRQLSEWLFGGCFD